MSVTSIRVAIDANDIDGDDLAELVGSYVCNESDLETVLEEVDDEVIARSMVDQIGSLKDEVIEYACTDGLADFISTAIERRGLETDDFERVPELISSSNRGGNDFVAEFALGMGVTHPELGDGKLEKVDEGDHVQPYLFVFENNDSHRWATNDGVIDGFKGMVTPRIGGLSTEYVDTLSEMGEHLNDTEHRRGDKLLCVDAGVTPGVFTRGKVYVVQQAINGPAYLLDDRQHRRTISTAQFILLASTAIERASTKPVYHQVMELFDKLDQSNKHQLVSELVRRLGETAQEISCE